MRMRTFVIAAGALAAVYLYRRSKTPLERRDLAARRFMNERLTPILLSRGAADGSRNGIGIVEHVGRVSGTLRRTLVHPIVLDGQVAIPLPYRDQGQWMRNVLAAGCCRLQFRDQLYGLTRPRVAEARAVAALPRFERAIVQAIGGSCLVMDVESVVAGRFDELGSEGRSVEPQLSPM
jgi:hypothetical protein